MSVQITKPITNLREELNDLHKPSGVAGEAILRAETSHDAFNIIGAGRKNLLINGNFDIWERGTSFTNINNQGNTADRWTSHAVVNGSQQSFAVGQKVVPGEPRYFLRHSATSTAAGFHQKIEDVRTAAGQTITFSFWAKASKKCEGDVLFRQRFGSGGSSTVFEDLTDALKLTTEWQYYTFTHRMADIHAKTVGAGSFLEVGTYVDGLSAGDSIDLARAQCEIGRVNTPFEYRSYGEELNLCKRYFQNVYNGQCFGSANTTTRMRINAPLSPEMRTDPTVARVTGTISFQGMGVSVTSTSTTIAQSSPSGTHYLGMDLGGFSGLTGRSYAGSHSRTLVFTADAEL